MKKLRSILLFFLCSSVLYATEPKIYSFTHFNTSNSTISYDGVSTITQDSRGYIWIGTFKGLNRFDGTRFKVFYKKDLGLDSDFIHTIVEDTEGNLWVGTDNGLTRYIYTEDRFEPFTIKADNGAQVRNKVTFLFQDSRGRMWIVANYQGCFCYDPQKETLVNYTSMTEGRSEYNTDETAISFRRMAEDSKGGFWVSKYHHGILYAASDMTHMEQIQTVNDPSYFNGDEVEQMWLLGGELLVASNLHGLSLYNPGKCTVKNLFSLAEGVTLVNAYLQGDEYVWLCTTDGIWRYSIEDGSHIHISSDSSDPLSFSGHYVFTVYVDRESGVWIGTKDGGVNYCGPSQKNIQKIQSASSKSLSGSIVTDFSTDGKGCLWITTENVGLLKYIPGKGGAEMVNVPGLPSNLCCCCYDEGRLWLGSLNGLYCYYPSSGRLVKYGPLKRRSGVIDPRVYRTFRTKGGDLYFSNTLGLFRYQEDSDDFRQISDFDGVFPTSLCEAPDGTIWVSSYAQGLLHYDPRQNVLLSSFKSDDGSGLPSDKIASVFIDNKSRLWAIGFSCGLSLLGEDGKFKVFDKSSCPSLPSDVLFGAVQDNDGEMWLSSDKGLVRFSPDDISFSRYSIPDGLLDTKLTNSLFCLPSGEIYAGSDNGFIHFDPYLLRNHSRAPDIIISKMGIGDSAVKGNVDLMGKVKLKNSQNSFGFHFSVMSFDHPGANSLRCLLEGYDRQWKDISSEKSVYYFNVPPGKYSLRIMSSCGGIDWEESHKPVEILISPPFMSSFAGIVIISVAMLLVLALVFFLVNRRQNAIRKAEEEEIRKATEEESFRDKINFFSHVVHEIKTPLTLIRTPLQSIVGKEQFDEDARHDLQVMQSNTEYLTSLVNELLEFVRVERKGYVLNCTRTDLTERLSSILFNYKDTAANRNIRISSEISGSHIWINADSSALDKIVNNILINALKHSETTIVVSLKQVDGMAVLDVSNDGDTIPEEYRKDVFRPFVQYHEGDNKLRKGVGIGLPLARSLARMHSGDIELSDGENGMTRFVFTIPVCEPPQMQDNNCSDGDFPAMQQNENNDALPTVLVVDDNDEMRDFISRKFTPSYSVITAKNADMAITALSDNNVDVMISDISMPGRDGLELCREIRKSDEISHIPIIILSARTSVESKISAMEAGADLYIEKPFDLDYLRISVRNILDRRSLMRKAIGSGIGSADITMFGLPKRDEEFFHNFDSIILDNISNSELSNEYIAGKLNMSQSTLIRKIRKMLNTSPNNYIRGKRLSLAAKMLGDSQGNNITDICYSVGFTNVSYFSKCFKEQYGVTPSEYCAK